MTFTVLPAIDLMDGRCVRLTQGKFNERMDYDLAPLEMARWFERMGYAWLHVIDLDGARLGFLKNLSIIKELIEKTSLNIQVGGGLRSFDVIAELFELGVARVIVGSLMVKDPDTVRKIIERFGADRIVIAMDVKGDEILIGGWEVKANLTIKTFVDRVNSLGANTVLCTDVECDGMMQGPRVERYANLVQAFPGIRWIAAGGVNSPMDCASLEKVGITQGVVGKAFYEGSFLAKRVIPCLDIDGGRTVKGVCFSNLSDAGDPVDLARRYEVEGADELIFLDITATSVERALVVDLAHRVSRELSIPFTVGGGIRTLEDISAVLNAGADKVSIESEAVLNPKFVSDAALYFGSQALIISISPKRRSSGGWDIYVRGGRENTKVDLIEFLNEMQDRGAGEILLNSIDEDGRGNGYDLEMLKAARRVLRIPLIASSGAGNLVHFYDGIFAGGADAVLAASVFHYGKFTIREVKNYLQSRGVLVRLPYA